MESNRSDADAPGRGPDAHAVPFDVPLDAEVYRVRCSADAAQHLLRFDHHRVRVDGRLGVLVTYPLMGRRLTDPVDVWIVVHRSASQHPTAPADVQAIIDHADPPLIQST